LVRVLEEMPQLQSELDAASARAARVRCVAPKLLLDEGRWSPPDDGERCRGSLGLLVMAGLLSRTVEVEGHRAQELLGPGDVLRPWDDEGAMASICSSTTWTVLQPTTIAVLDARFAAAAAQWPGVGSALLRAAVQRGYSRSVLLAVAQARRADHRLLMLFWHLADRWGRVTPDGVCIPLRLTHERLAELVCLRRPTVSMTLTELRESGAVTRRSDGTWCLRGSALSQVGDRPAAAAGADRAL
jgi:CRP-like cAMP-binding protein